MNISIIPKSCLISLYCQFLSLHPQPLEATGLITNPIILPFWTSHINGITQYGINSMCPFESGSFHPEKSYWLSCVLFCITEVILFFTQVYGIIWMYCDLYIHLPPLKGHLGGFWLLAIINGGALNICVQVCGCSCMNTWV